MKQGTVSILVGCHSPLHSLWVLIAWVKHHHRLPRPWELMCILLHDIGHWGKDYLDDIAAKRLHYQLGAKLAGRLFGPKGFDLVAGHDPHSGYPASALLKPDKASFLVAPRWWLYTNLFFEPKIRGVKMSRREHIDRFLKLVRENVESGHYGSNHDIFMAQDASWKETMPDTPEPSSKEASNG